MRLFVAVELPEDWKTALDRAVRDLRAGCTGITPTRRENFHLTLAFLGEVEGPGRAAAALDRVRAPCFDLRTAGPGRFRGRGGDLWWLGVEPDPGLMEVQRALAEALAEEGFRLEDRPFRPHLTLGRRVVTGKRFREEAWRAALPRLECRVEELTLMRSHRVEGVLTYTPLCRRALGEGGSGENPASGRP